MSASFGLTMRKNILTMRKMTPKMRAQQASMRANYFIAKIAHMVTDNERTNLVRIWSITYTYVLGKVATYLFLCSSK